MKARQSIYDLKNNRISVYKDMRTNELIDQMLQEEYGSSQKMNWHDHLDHLPMAKAKNEETKELDDMKSYFWR